MAAPSATGLAARVTPGLQLTDTEPQLNTRALRGGRLRAVQPAPGALCDGLSHRRDSGGAEGVKLEELVLVTESGCIVLSRFPFEEALLD